MKTKFSLCVMLIALCIAYTFTGCHFAASHIDGDTIASYVFEPEDTMSSARVNRNDTTKSVQVVDSVGIYYVGTGSTRQFLQLVSYPSRRDTLVYGKTRHIKVRGNADFNNIVRVKFYLLNGKDSLVCAVEQVVL